MTSCIAADNEPPSAEMLLYLAEFSDDEGKPDDPLAVDRELPASTEVTEPTPAATTDDEQPDAQPVPEPR